MITILDFQITAKSENNFALEIFQRDSSQPLAKTKFEFQLDYMTDFQLNQLEFDGRDPAGRFDRLKEFGKTLYQKLFTPEVEKIWEEYKTDSDFLVLCLRIDPETSGLEKLPWETLNNGEEFIAAGAKTGMSRLPLDIAPQKTLDPIPRPLNMLALVSSPMDLGDGERLNMEQEQEHLLRAVNDPAGAGRIDLTIEDEAKLSLLEAELENGYAILHYSGHGFFDESGGGLLLENDRGNKRTTGTAEILDSLQKGEKSLRLAVLSGCQTARTLDSAGFADLARGLIRRRHLPGVIAMQFSLSDTAGMLFARTLYEKIAADQSLEIAVSSTRRELLRSDENVVRADAFAPVLLTSCGECLHTTEPETADAGDDLDIDFSFYLQLPQLKTRFYGRRKEYRAIRDGLIGKDHRLVMIHGIGGIGKTALASHAAARLKDHFKGVYAFDCSTGALSPESVLLELHRYLKLRGVKALEQLLHASLKPAQLGTFLGQVLCQLPLLLIFDNFESQLTDTTNGHAIRDDNLRVFLNTLVKTTESGTRFIFTSRYLFDLDEKRIGDVITLPLHDLSLAEALGLMQKLPHLSHSSHENKLAAFEKFGGHPYALIALDRHCGEAPLDKILQDARSVKKELRGFLAIELNYKKLSDRSRELLNKLAAFKKPVELAAAEWVMGEKVKLGKDFLDKLNRDEMPDELKKMSDEELLKTFEEYLPEQRRAEDMSQPIRELINWGVLTPIFDDGKMQALAVHSLVRDFCRDSLTHKVWKQHLIDAAAYFTNQTKLVSHDEKSPAAVFTEMEAFDLLVEAEEFEEAANLLVDAHELISRWGFDRYLESRYLLLFKKVDRKTEPALIHNHAMLLGHRGDFGAALEGYQKSLKIEEELGNKAGVAQSLHQIGYIHYQRGDYPAALEGYQKSLKIFQDIGDKASISAALHQIGMIHQHRGDYEAALKGYQKSLKTFQDIGDKARMSAVLHQIGRIHHDRGDYPAALEGYQKSLKIKQDIGDKAGVAKSLHQIGMIHHDRGDYPAALEKYQKSLKIEEELGNKAGVAITLHQIGNIHYDRGDYPAAMEQYQKSLKIKQDIGDKAGVAITHGQFGKLFFDQKNYAEAFHHFLNAFSIFSEIQSPYAKQALNDLKSVRKKWGAKNFAAAWKKATGEDVPKF